jgi:hypothetical protein
LNIQVRTIWAALLAVMLAGGLVAIAQPANAAVIVVCNKNGAAPAMSASAGVITYFYSHRCNSINGVTKMTESLYLDFSSSSAPIHCNGDSFTRASQVPQTGVDFSAKYAVLSCHGTYTPAMSLIIDGNFSFGSVPGCGRLNPVQVVCRWEGVPAGF